MTSAGHHIMMEEASGLPPGVKKVAYIEIPGGSRTQEADGAYIDTGIKPKTNATAEIVCRYVGTTYSSAAAMPIFGMRIYPGTIKAFGFFVQSSTLRLAINYGSVDTGWKTQTINTNDFFTLRLESNAAYCNGSQFATFNSPISGTYQNTVTIGSINQTDVNGTRKQVRRGVILQIKSFKMWNNNLLEGDFEAVGANGNGFLYNKINGLYLPYGNAGNYQINAGPEI